MQLYLHILSHFPLSTLLKLAKALVIADF